MKDIGIITIYHKNYNAGGLLQAYAMQKTLESLGYSSEVIAYDRYAKKVAHSKIENIKKKIARIPQIILNQFHKNLLINRKRAFLKFEDTIPHSAHVYNGETILEATDHYRGFICGSDQIWNPSFATNVDFLSFAHGKFKASYAASIGVNSLNEKEKERYFRLLKDFNGVSVREKHSIELLDRINNIKYVVDPTMLINAESWSRMAGKRSIERNFLFAYFLGDSKIQREYVKQYSKYKNIYSVTFRHVKLQYRFVDKEFCNQNIEDGGPKEFIRCIRDADVIFTDSFHAVVFSIIFKKQFYIINRFNNFDSKSQNIRIFDLLERFGISDRQINAKNLDIPDIDYDLVYSKLQSQKAESLEWLREILKRGL